MAATIAMNEWNGTVGVQVGTPKGGGTIKFKSADDAVNDNNDPLVKPSVGVYRSYEKWLRASITDLDDAASISNIEVYVTGTPGTGISIWAKTVETYCDAEGNPLADPNTPYAGGRSSSGAMPGPKTNLFTYTSANPLSLGAGPYAVNEDDGDIVEAGIGEYLVLQMEVLPSATVGTTRSYGFKVTYEED